MSRSPKTSELFNPKTCKTQPSFQFRYHLTSQKSNQTSWIFQRFEFSSSADILTNSWFSLDPLSGTGSSSCGSHINGTCWYLFPLWSYRTDNGWIVWMLRHFSWWSTKKNAQDHLHCQVRKHHMAAVDEEDVSADWRTTPQVGDTVRQLILTTHRTDEDFWNL